MKYYLLLFSLLIIVSCKTSINSNVEVVTAVKKQLHAVQVTVTDTLTAKANESEKNILVDLGNRAGSGNADVLTDAYQIATTAYQTGIVQKYKIPTVYSIQVKVNGVTNSSFNYKSAYLSNSAVLEKKIKSFMDAIIQKRYNDLASYMEPGLDLSPIINIFKNADAGGDGVTSYTFISLQHGTGIHNPDKKPMNVIQGWVLITGKASNRHIPMLFIANPTTGQLSSVYINPAK